MPEPTTRDEHVAEAVSRLRASDFQHQHGSDSLLALREAVVALAYATLAATAPVEPSPWTWAGSISLRHSSGDWDLEYTHSCETDEHRPRPGWYLYGPPFKGRSPLWVGNAPDEAMASADKGIAGVVDMLPRTWRWNGTEYDLTKKYRSTRGDFTYEFVGTLTDGMPLMRQYPAGVRALINPAATVLRMVGPLVAVDEDEVPF
ncbi:hypothetical protein OG216_09950 [Streptomycetaceae bacterium NBC_01309]